MNGSTPIEDQLLAKYVADEADAAERMAVEQWAAIATANALELERMRAIWSWSIDDQAMPEVDVEAAWKGVSDRIENAEGGSRVILIGSWSTRRWIAAAAVIAGLVFATRLWMSSDEQVFLSEAAYTSVQLDDKSAVVLSPGSRIEVKLDDKREVDLTGEAYFEVHSDTARPFVITADAIEVTVLGTAFTVSAYDTSGTLTVRVREGRVQVVADAETLVLTAGEQARFDKERHLLERVVSPPAEIWGERIIQFDEAPLPLVIAQLQSLFPVRIVLGNPSMANCKLTATFEDEPIDQILDVIAQTYGLAVTTADGDIYTLEGNGCE